MKNILIILAMFVIGCSPVKYVNVEKKHNYYQKHRSTTYTSPTWVPGQGIVLETKIYKHPKRKQQSRHKH